MPAGFVEQVGAVGPGRSQWSNDSAYHVARQGFGCVAFKKASLCRKSTSEGRAINFLKNLAGLVLKKPVAGYTSGRKDGKAHARFLPIQSNLQFSGSKWHLEELIAGNSDVLAHHADTGPTSSIREVQMWLVAFVRRQRMVQTVNKKM